MSASIQTLCVDALDRVDITPEPGTLDEIAAFVSALDRRAAGLDALDRIELGQAAAEYTTAWVIAEQLEATCRDFGLFTAHDGVRSAVSRAASERARMRQILKAIKSLLNSAPKPDGDNAPAIPPQAVPTDATPMPDGEGDTPSPRPVAPEPPHVGPIDDAAPEHEEPVAPPMNRAQRRAQARLDAKLHRKEQKRSRYAEANTAAGT